jgi:hypothetical protein
VQVVTFPYDILSDTVDDVAAEMQKQFKLSDTDCEIAASSMRQVMALQVSLQHSRRRDALAYHDTPVPVAQCSITCHERNVREAHVWATASDFLRHGSSSRGYAAK